MGIFGTTKRTLVVDLAAVLKAKGVRGRAQPRQQLQVLRSLSRLVQREKMNVTAVLVGKPLNKTVHNKKLDGVRVRYAKVDNELNAQLRKALDQAGRHGVLVTEDVAIENKVIRSGKDTLRVSTFRKLLDDGNEPLSNPGGANRGNNRNNNNNRDRGPRPNRKNDRPKNDRPKNDRPKNARPKMDRKTQEQDEISQMIDLVE